VLTSARSPKYQAVPNVALSAAHWNEKGSLEKANWVRKTHSYAADYNETLRKLLKRVQQLVDDNPTWGCEQVRTALNGSGTQDFLAHMRLDVARRVQATHARPRSLAASTTSSKASVNTANTSGKYHLHF
jgi:hypothetical protein